MIINSKVYGKRKITEPVLLEIIKSPSIQRLKKISQFGLPDEYYHFKNFSRYDHSIGVMLLLKRLGATLEEQVAGLIHDVSVLAFSHVTDWVFSDGKKGVESYHDSIHESFVKKTEIPGILKKHCFELNRILNEENFTLLEKKIPDLCADRVDYALQEFNSWLNPKAVKKSLQGLVNLNGEIVFSDPESAFIFATHFLKLNAKHWGGFESMIRYYLFSNSLKVALEKKIIEKKDFFKDEPFVLKKLSKSKDATIKKTLVLLRKKSLKEIERKSGKKVFKKFRHVDPKVIRNGKLIRLSKMMPKFRDALTKYKKMSEKGLRV